jgi:hypothetical protein
VSAKATIRNFGAAALAAGAATAVLAGCGGDAGDEGSRPVVRQVTAAPADTGPYADLSGRQLLDRALTSMKGLSAVTVDMQTTDDDDTPMHITAAVTDRHLCAANVRDGDSGFELIRAGAYFYLDGDAAYWRTQGTQGGRLAKFLAGKWLKVPASDADAHDFNNLCDLRTMIDSISEGATDGTLTKGRPVTYQGRTVIPVVQKSDGDTTDVYVSAGPTPYVLRVWNPDDGTDSALFTGFGTSPHISAPPPGRTIDVSSLGGDDHFSV